MAGGVNPFGFSMGVLPAPRAPRQPQDLPSAPFGFAPKPSKMQQTLAILNEYNPLPAFERLLKSPMAMGGPISERDIADGLTVAGTVTGGSAAAPKPKNALNMGVASPSPKKFVYSMRYRPPANATVPPGFSAFGDPTPEYKFGTVEYDRPLSSKDVEDFELMPLDPQHPFNIKKSFDDFQGKFVDEFSEAGEKYRSPSGDFIVTPNMSGDGWQVTHFAADGQPAGHDIIADFDELTRLVWASQK